MDINNYKAKPDKTIGEHCQELIKNLLILKKLGYIQTEKLYELTKYACLHHDDGKVNEEFQKRVSETGKKLRFNEEKEVPHNVLSGYFINKDDFSTDDDYYRVLHAILNHHDYGDVYAIMKDKKALIQYLLRDFHTYEIKTKVKNKTEEMVRDSEAIKIKGFLHKCDYSASGDYIVEYPNDFLKESLENVKQKWQTADPSSNWNGLQKFCMEKCDENIIVVAQTGMGKTEAGLHWIGNHKGYFVLPIRTAINAIYDRVRKDMLRNEELDTRLGILHSESLEYYTDKLENREFDLYDYEKNGKQFCLPLNISTMDQLFDFVFMHQGFELKLTTLTYSKIVIDEIQMYDPELLAYLIYGLKMITQLGGKAAIMTATLSPFVKELLMRGISFTEDNIKTFVDDSTRHNIAVYDRKINAEDIMEKYRRNEQEGKSNKILVVCNTIKEAQRLYHDLKQYADENTNLNILHSRYTREDRARLEEKIKTFGRTFNEKGKLDIQAGIWVSTSLVEVSLDIDFDYLFTELQDLNSLFQRMGRCNRKGKKSVLEANCYIYTEIAQGTLSCSTNGFIDETLFSLSKDAIQAADGKLSEKRKLELLNEALTMEHLKKSDYYRNYKKAMEFVEGIPAYKFKKNENKLRNILSENIIPSTIYKKHQEEIKSWEHTLKTGKMDYIERMKIRTEIMKYSVSIPYWEWIDYKKSVISGKAESYPQICLGGKEAIQVVECDYDISGYRKIDYNNVIRTANVL